MLYGAMNFPINPVLDELDAIADLGFDYMELTMDPTQAHYSTIREKEKTLIKALERHRLALVCHLPTFVSTADITKRIREVSVNEVLESLQTAADLNSLKVVLHPGHIRGLGVYVKDLAKAYMLESLEAIVSRADQLKLPVCLENMFPAANSLIEPDDFSDALEQFPTLKLTLDTGHANIEDRGEERILGFINRFGNRIDHIHASDNLGREDNHLPIGTGTVDFPTIVSALKGIGYDNTITLEIFSRDRDYLSISRDKLAAMFAAT